jgi:predicted Zn-dependent protease with MMP-like domain
MEIRAEIVGVFINEALQEYKKANKGALPDKIVVYRDGFGSPSMFESIKLFEPEYLLEQIKTAASGYNPKLMYSLVDKNRPQRIFI